MIQKVLYTLGIAGDAILHNKLRAVLTSLGIVFGVASVIAMLAVGRGAQEQILEQIRLLGATNIIITPRVEQQEGRAGEEEAVDGEEEPAAEEDDQGRKRYTPGLTLADAESIARHIPGVRVVSPEIVVETTAIRSGYRRSVKLVGVEEAYFPTTALALAAGRGFTDRHYDEAAPVAVIGSRIARRFFPKESALGGRIKAGHLWLTVVGVLEEQATAAEGREHLGLRDYNLDIYVPLPTQLLRFRDRARVDAGAIRRARQMRRWGARMNQNQAPQNFNQVDRIVVQAEASALVQPVADVVTRMLQRRHNGVVDYQVTVPELLLKQEEQTQRLFNIVLAAIASISLLVGGIGIMNIMLASVMERTREIGVRRSLGATRRDIILQFLIEAVAISVTGGVLGVALGVGTSLVIESATDIPTIVTPLSVVLAFVVSVSVGLVFGLLPARRAAQHDPVVALRHE